MTEVVRKGIDEVGLIVMALINGSEYLADYEDEIEAEKGIKELRKRYDDWFDHQHEYETKGGVRLNYKHTRIWAK